MLVIGKPLGEILIAAAFSRTERALKHSHGRAAPPRYAHLVATDGDWQIWAYRGAAIRSSGVVNTLQMPGHPLDGQSYATLEAARALIDGWLDHGDPPKPFVWPQPPKTEG